MDGDHGEEAPPSMYMCVCMGGGGGGGGEKVKKGRDDDKALDPESPIQIAYSANTAALREHN